VIRRDGTGFCQVLGWQPADPTVAVRWSHREPAGPEPRRGARGEGPHAGARPLQLL